jgi:hypothetical protein
MTSITFHLEWNFFSFFIFEFSFIFHQTYHRLLEHKMLSLLFMGKCDIFLKIPVAYLGVP